jgi:glycosyltransferase involved in cell wall biosynthesis
MKRSGCDLVYTNSITVGAGAMAAKLAGIPHVWHLREFGYADYRLSFDLGQRVSSFLMRRLASACIANSKAVAKAYTDALGETPLHVVYNAADVPAVLDDRSARAAWRNPNAIRCLLLGKYISGKGQEDAVNAMRSLREMKVPAELLLVGETLDQEYRRHIESLVKRFDLSDHVRIMDHCRAPAPLMKSSDVVLMCSRSEAFGRVTVEGMKFGKPVIGTSSGGTPEIIDDGVTGYLYEPGDYHALAARIAELQSNKALRTRIGRDANASARARFNKQKYGIDILTVLRDVLAMNGPCEGQATANHAVEEALKSVAA